MSTPLNQEPHSIVDFGKSNTFVDVSLSGKFAGHDLIEFTTTSETAASVQTKHDLMDAITQLQVHIAELSEAPKGDREDAADELAKAKRAAEENDKDRLLNKLESAQKILVAFSGALPAAVKLSEVIGTLLQRVPSLI